MLIECLIRREGGSRITLDGENYHFKPDGSSSPAHICEVASEEHARKLLAIKDGYRRFNAIEPIKMPDKFIVPESAKKTVIFSHMKKKPTKKQLAERYYNATGKKATSSWKISRLQYELDMIGVPFD